MVKSKQKFPRVGEFVMARVVEIEHQYVYVDLVDYEGLQSEKHARGMIHVSEISSRWIKNMRNFVRINQIIVLRVLKVDKYKGHVDCSLRRVNSAQKEQRKKEQKLSTKFETLMEFLSTETDLSLDDAYEQIGFPILDFYDSYQEALEELKENGEEVLKQIPDISEDISKLFLKIVDENIEVTTVNIIGKVKLSFISENGVENIKETLLEALKVVKEQKETRSLNISYIATPYYRLEIVSKDYIDAEEILSDTLEIIDTKTTQFGGEFEFIRD